MPKRIQRKRTKGWRMPPNTVSVCRPGRWGNPYDVATFGRVTAIALFHNSVRGCWSPSIVEHLSDELCHEAYKRHCEFTKKHGGGARIKAAAQSELRGKDLACYCKLNDTCHADVLLEVANA